MASVAYNIGQLVAAFEKAGALPGWNIYLQGIQATNLTVVEGIKGLAQRGKMAVIESIMADLPAEALPTHLSVLEQGDYALGYQHYKANKANKPELKTERYEIKLSQVEKAWVLANSGLKLSGD